MRRMPAAATQDAGRAPAVRVPEPDPIDRADGVRPRIGPHHVPPAPSWHSLALARQGVLRSRSTGARRGSPPHQGAGGATFGASACAVTVAP
jgi:hypothetical protein